MLGQSDCETDQNGLAEGGFRWRVLFDRALKALATGATAVAFIGSFRVGIEAWPQDNTNPSRGMDW